MASDLQRAFDALVAKQRPYRKLWQYYDGRQPLVYSTERLQSIFQRIDARFSENWCGVVVDSMLDRVELKQFTVNGSDESTAQLNLLFESTELNLDAHDAHCASLVCGESYVIVWKDAEADEVEAYYNDPMLCHVFYEPDRPRVPQFAAKWWTGDDERQYMTLYYRDRLEYYASTSKSVDVGSYTAFHQTQEPETNPFGRVPVFHLRRSRRRIASELETVVEPQNAVNKLLADMMIAAEFGAMRQRYIISQTDPGDLKNAPNQNWWIPAGDGSAQPTQVGQFDSTDLSNYLNAIDKLTTAIGAISRTPKHYFFQQGGDPSGDALVAMEAPLNKKTSRFVAMVKPVWRDIAEFMMVVNGTPVDRMSITPEFGDVRSVQPKAQAEIRKSEIDAGIPLVTALRREGWTQADIDQMLKDKGAESKQQQETMAEALARAQRNFDRGGEEQLD